LPEDGVAKGVIVKSAFFAIAAAAMALAACETGHHAPGVIEGAYPGEMIIYNGGSTPIVQVDLRVTGDPEWHPTSGPDIPSGDKMGINLADIPICLWDFRFKTSGGEESEYIAVDACSVSSLRFPKG
jgi:hypothetical protein